MSTRLRLTLVLLAALLGGAPLAAFAARSETIELKSRSATLGRLPRIEDDGNSYVSAEKLAAILKGSWLVNGSRGSLTVGKRSAHFTRNVVGVVVQGKTIALDTPPRSGRSDWLIPEEFLVRVLPRLTPGVAAVMPEQEKRVTLPPRPAVGAAPEPAKPAPPPARTAVAAAVPEPAKPTPPPARTAVAAAVPETAKPAPRPARPSVGFEELRYRSYPTYTRVVVEARGTVEHSLATGRGELRVRMPDLALPAPRAEAIADGLVKAVRLESAGGETSLIVELESAAGDVKLIALEDPFRIVLDVYRPVERPPAGIAPSAPDPLRLIVIDPGHGGHDPGAHGPTGLREKDVVLDVSKRVARMVEEELGITVAMTRTTDTFIPLRERTNFANKQRADLFVSIHANAHPRSVSEGVETYFLSSEASDTDARQTAAIENGVVRLESPASRAKTDLLKTILWDLAQSEFQRESSFMAETVQDSMTRSLKLVNRGVKQAGFYVLGGAAMPAILIEIGFLTNPKEERKLASSEHREALARAIFEGLAEYKRRHDQRLNTAAVPVKEPR